MTIKMDIEHQLLQKIPETEAVEPIANEETNLVGTRFGGMA